MGDQTAKANFGDAISAAIVEKVTPEFIEEKIATRAEKMIEEVIAQEMRSYGEIGKQVEAAVKESLKVDRLDLPSYGHMVTSMLQAQIERTVSPIIAGQLSEDMERLLKLGPKTIKLSEIVATIVEDSYDEEWGEVCTCIVEPTEYGSRWIYLDETVVEEPSSSLYSSRSSKSHKCDVQILLSEDGTISSATFRGADMKTIRQIGHGNYGLEQRIRAYHACRTIIEVDEDAVITSRGDY